MKTIFILLCGFVLSSCGWKAKGKACYDFNGVRYCAEADGAEKTVIVSVEAAKK